MDYGHNYLGVDASPVMVDIANKSGIETWHGLFNIELAKKIEKKYKKLILYSRIMFLTTLMIYTHLWVR